MSKPIETSYEGRYKSTTVSPINEEPINVSASRFGPIDLLSAAYSSCLLFTIDNAARKNQFETAGARSEIAYDLNEEQDRLGKINVRLFFADEYTDEQKEVIEMAAKHQCHIGNSFDKSVRKEFEFIYNGK